jgi:hypothetical protein
LAHGRGEKNSRGPNIRAILAGGGNIFLSLSIFQIPKMQKGANQLPPMKAA